MARVLPRVLIGIAIGLAVAWIALAVTLLMARPKGSGWRDAMRLLPDTIRLLRNIAADRSLPRGIRIRLWLLFCYLALPIDLIPDFIPVLGYADDAVIVALVLRSVVRRAGPEAVARHWTGSKDGLAALWRLARLEPAKAAP